MAHDGSRTYTDGPAPRDATVSYEWAHGLGEVVTALVAAGLTVRSLRESDALPWQRRPLTGPVPVARPAAGRRSGPAIGHAPEPGPPAGR